MSRQDIRHALFEQFAALAQALGHGHRLELLELLAQSERSVEVLAKLTGATVGNISQHLHKLKRAGLVTTRRKGKFVYYRLTDEYIVTLLTALRRTAERNLAQVSALASSFFRERDGLKPVSSEELMRMMREGTVTVIDVRPAEEFAAGHLAGAINVPLKELEQRLKELPMDRDIVAYCRGPYCVLAYEAVALMRARGLRALRLEPGYPEWRAAGLPVEAP
jgi:rhodanese-related sulfurtransferase/DNA-binding HxlR family transcriptional regulator